MGKKIVIFGSGNVATHLAAALDRVYDVKQIISPNPQHASALAKRMRNATATSNIKDAINDADIYLIAVKDDAISEIVSSTAPDSGLWLHTSGSVGVEVFSPYKKNYGVFYPLQTFSKDVKVDISAIPLFIEGSSDLTESEIRQIAGGISTKVFHADSHQRRQLHIAAVFACNFANRLWAIADKILSQSGYNFDILAPLLQATLNKAIATSPLDGQTGPARRGDNKIISSHISSLNGEDADIYRLISSSIFNQYNNEQD